MKSRRVSVSHRKSVKQIGPDSVIEKKACLAAIAESHPSCRLGPSQMLRICKSHQLKQKQQTQSLNNHGIDFCECVLSLFSPAQLTSTDPKPATIKNIRNLSQITFVRTENVYPTYQTWCLRLFGCICLRNSAVSRPIGASLPHAQHI